MNDSDDESADQVRLFGELLGACHRELFGFVYSLIQHHADAEDVYQQVTVILWEKFDQFEIGTNFAAWATRVAQLTAKDFLRSRRKRSITFSDGVLEAIAAVHESRCEREQSGAKTAEALESCLNKLPPRERHLVGRCYSPDRDFSAIAKEQGRTIDAIYQAISRIRKTLFQCVLKTLAREEG